MFRSITGRKLTFAYITALLVVASLATADFIVQRMILSDSESTQRIKDITATQRTLVQSIAFLTQSITLQSEQTEKQIRLNQISELSDRLDRTLDLMTEDFKNADHVSFPLTEDLTPHYYTEALSLQKQLQGFKEHVKNIVDTDLTKITPRNPHVRYVVDTAEKELYGVLDMFVYLTVLDTQKRLRSLGVVDTVTYILVMTLLVIAGFFLFRPVVSAVIQQQANQSRVNERLEERAEALEHSRLKLRKQTRILKSVLNTMGDAVIVVDESGKLLMQNPAADRLFGSMEEGTASAVWQHQAGLKHPETQRDLLPSEGPIQQALQGKWFNEYLFRVDNQRNPLAKIVSATGRKMVDEENVVRGAVISFHDISDRISKEHELIESKIRAESANISKTQFLANMSHEIRTPMGAILGYADRLLIPTLSSHERSGIVQVIRRNAKVLMNIIDDLLDISRVETGNLNLEKQNIQVQELVSEVYSLLVNKAEQKNITLRVTFEGALPKSIHTDPTRLRQILINVVGNAIKFTDHGQVDLIVRMLNPIRSKTNTIEFAVKDSGCGIRRENVGKLFKPFAQVDASTTRRFTGTGLGLNLSRKLAQALGGDLVLSETEFGKGSTFVITIDPGDLEGAMFTENIAVKSIYVAEAVQEFEQLFPTAGLEDYHILVVDDGEENRELFSYYLKRAGAKVDLACDGVEGVEKALAKEYDLILLDIQMPHMDGYQAVSTLREKKYRRPIAALTAHAMKGEKERCKAAGFDEHLAKPIDAHTLVMAAKQLVLLRANVSETGPGNNVFPIRQGGVQAAANPKRGTPDAVLAIINRFVQAVPGKVNEIVTALDQKRYQDFQKMVHRLKGTAGACGFLDFMSELESIEEAFAAKESPTSLKVRVERIEKLIPKEYNGALDIDHPL